MRHPTKHERRIVKIRRRHGPGSPPGQIVPPKQADQPTIRVMAYGPAGLIDEQISDLTSVQELRIKHSVVWLDVCRFGDANLIQEVGQLFDLHRLALEDAINTHQRPKVEEYDDHLFLIARMLQPDKGIDTEQVAFFLGQGFVITFQEELGDCFDPIRQRIRHAKGRIRSAGADYLCYALIDAIVDVYFPCLERYGEALEELEDEVVQNPGPSQVGELHNMKRDLLMLRRAIWPHREMINKLVRDEHRLISSESLPYLRDCYDHTIQLMDIVETYREINSGLLDIYISSVNVKLSEVMKFLTIIATVFMPLSFIASLYGMNFDHHSSPWNMPELSWYFGYPFALLLMLASAIGLLGYSWRQGWLVDNRIDGTTRRFPPGGTN